MNQIKLIFKGKIMNQIKIDNWGLQLRVYISRISYGLKNIEKEHVHCAIIFFSSFIDQREQKITCSSAIFA